MARLDRSEIVAEFENARLGDERLDRRLVSIVERLASAPDASIPSVVQSQAESEAMYRFFANARVSLEGVLSGHIDQTLKRCAEAKRVRVVHDTTSLAFGGDREGLGPIRGVVRGHGFFAHVALSVSGDEQRRPLGILGTSTYVHPKESRRKNLTRAEDVSRLMAMPRDEKTSSRWEKLAQAIQDSLPAGVEAVHVMDQEADDFVLFSELLDAGVPFVVRGSGTRLTELAKESVSKVLERATGVLLREVQLEERTVRRARSSGHPTRSKRKAELFVRWANIDLRKPNTVSPKAAPRSVPVTVVHVYEPNPPEGETPIEWFLFTSEEVASLESAARTVDDYRARWLIEELFKALKTGCAIEKRQLTTFDGLNRILGVSLPIAWRLLLLRNLSREAGDLPASEVMNKEQVGLLSVLLQTRRKDHKLAAKPTVRDIMLAIAALGGHIRNNGDPGWLVLGRGFQIFTDAEAVWAAARCDQS